MKKLVPLRKSVEQYATLAEWARENKVPYPTARRWVLDKKRPSPAWRVLLTTKGIAA